MQKRSINLNSNIKGMQIQTILGLKREEIKKILHFSNIQIPLEKQVIRRNIIKVLIITFFCYIYT